MRLPFLFLITALMALAFSVPAASAATGDLTFSSCQSNAAITSQSCTVQTGLLDSVVGVQVSPDGKNAYAVATTSNALVVFDRNTTTGALTIKSGANGCFANATMGSCTVLTGQLSKPEALTISPDGKNVYVVASTGGTLLTFDRDTTTGVLTQKATPFGCHSNAALETCIVVTNQLDGVGAVSVSPDGKNLYTVSTISPGDSNGVVTTFTRDPLSGVLESASCVSSIALAACTVSSNQFDLGTAASSQLALSPDGRNAYLNALSTRALLIFDRNLTTGALTRKVGEAGCIANATLSTCTVLANYLPFPDSVTMSPDGANIYVTSMGTIGVGNPTITTFARNATTGELTKLVGAAGCLASETLNDCAVLNPAAQSTAALDSRRVAISPDGLNAYVTSVGWSMLLAFNRSTTTGELTLKAGATGCFSNSAMSPCTTTSGLLFAAKPVNVSPDGRNVYTGGTSTDPNISVFARVQPPTATAVTPARGTTAGGTSVVITGTNLDGATQVTFGGTAGKITATTPTSLTVTTPLHIAGKVAAKVTTPYGTSTLANAYTYAVPAVKAVIVAAKPTVAYSKSTITFRTIVTVNAAGTVNQVISRMVKGKRVAVCTRKKTIARAGKYPIFCVAGLATRNAVKRGKTSLRVLTSFNVTGAAVNSVQSLVLARKR